MTNVSAPQILVMPADEDKRSPAGSPPPDTTSSNERQKTQTNSEPRPSSTGKGFPNKLIRSLSSSNHGTGNTAQPSGSETKNQSTSMDPLSKHIIERTRPEALNIQKTRQLTTAEMEPTPAETIFSPTERSRPSTDLSINGVESPKQLVKDMKKNRVSFLSRFMGSKRRDSQPEQVEEEDDYGGKRSEGTNAEAFSHPIGYVPKFPEPPKYIKVRARGKKEKDFDRVFLAQELRGRTGLEVAQAGGRRINPSAKVKRGEAIWAVEFSRDGRFLAAGGHDHIVRVWGVIATEDDRLEHEREEEATKDEHKTKLNAPVFKRKPVQEYEGHTEAILDLTWSKNNFLLSSSMDKTVRLWHITRTECLCVFKHSDFVTSIQFHPRDDRFFLAGSLDSRIRLWSIPDKSVAYSSQASEIVTAVAFTPDGKTSIAGCLSGLCVFYETDGLRQQTQMHVRSAHGKNAKGSKITGIQAINYPPSDPNGDVKLLITSNDSRARLYNYRDKSLELKLKGPENSTSQIRASFSDDARYVISGSEDRKAYIWCPNPPQRDRDRRSMETFEAHSAIVTAAILAPTRTRQLLQLSGDPLYDLCNPPPVQLVSRTESHSSNPRSEIEECVPPTPSRPKPEESPAYIARSGHKNGNIIVTADFQGHIKVFRQDCAYKQRLRNNDNWDTASTFSKKVLNRSGSVATRNSRHSYQDSLAHPASDRILSWRQSIDRASLTNGSTNGSHDTFSTPVSRFNGFSLASSPRVKTPSSKRPANTNGVTTSASSTPTISASFSATSTSLDRASSSSLKRQHQAHQSSPQTSQEKQNGPPNPAVSIRGDSTNSLSGRAIPRLAAYWNNSRSSSQRPAHQNQADSTGTDIHATGHLKQPSDPSRWTPRPPVGDESVEISASSGEDEDEASESEESRVRCRRCGSEDFKARKRGKTGNVIVCGRCGLEAE